MSDQGRTKLEKVFGFRKLKKLEAEMKKLSLLEAEDYQKTLELNILSLAQRLSFPLTEPSWGPKAPQHVQTDKSAEIPQIEALSRDQFIAIQNNLELSERIARFSWLYVFAAVLGISVAIGALYFDYEIMTEFWTRVLADEFMEVPESLAGSVISKSAQVIFATAAFHFLLSRLAGWGRTLFIWIFFILTFGMIVGFGLMNANISMPTNPEALAPTSEKGPTSIRDALGDLGLRDQPERDDSVAVTTKEPIILKIESLIRDIRPILWLVVPGLVFVVVTGIGALCLQLTENNLQNYVISRDHKRRRKMMGELEDMLLYKTLIDRKVQA